MLPRIVTIQGATAAGKSALALKLAEKLGAHIVSADSRQVYRRLDIGTAKPPPAEQARVPHHLIDVIDVSERYSAGRFVREAGEIIAGLQSEGTPILVVGGTGFYVRTLLQGLFEAPDASPELHERLLAEAEEHGAAALHAQLAQVDAESAQRLHPNDAQRIVRALEVFETTGRPMSELWREQTASPRYESLDILVKRPRAELYRRIDRRYGEMLAAGLVEELRSVLAAGFAPESPGLRTVGYSELLPHVVHGAPLDECASLARQHTRNFAKRQLTWFRSCEFDLTTDTVFDNFSQTLETVERFLFRGELRRRNVE